MNSLTQTLTIVFLGLMLGACNKVGFETNKEQFLKSNGVFTDQPAGGLPSVDGHDAAIVIPGIPSAIPTESQPDIVRDTPTSEEQDPDVVQDTPTSEERDPDRIQDTPTSTGYDPDRIQGTNVPSTQPRAPDIYVDVNEVGELPVRRWCSDESLLKGSFSDTLLKTPQTPVVLSSQITITLKSEKGSVLCQSNNTSLIKSQIDDGKLNFKVLCGKSFPDRVSITIVNEKNEDLNSDNSSSFLRLKYADNPEYTDLKLSGISAQQYARCNELASPLFVDLRTEARGFKLTSPDKGILFDIQGENAKPVAHTKKQISWFKDAGMAMLVLPNSSGDVNGINELFGDNTRGPDGAFAPNGFAALAKHDVQQDNHIDANDPVYTQLSLWHDHDLNGIAGPGELLSLSYMGVESIDLEYDARFQETDRYGNQVKYKSVVNFRGGEMRLIYDLWFIVRN